MRGSDRAASLEKKLAKECLGNLGAVYDTIEGAKVDAAADRKFPGIGKNKKKKPNTPRWLKRCTACRWRVA